jgi:hypothetical protein
VLPARARATDPSSLALYHGKKIDLSVSWQGAQACSISDSGNTCYDTESEMNQATGLTPITQSLVVPLLTCSPVLKLYDNTSFNTPVLSLGTRGTWLQLSTWGFSAKTSSYIVGGCNSVFEDGSSNVYPGSTNAGNSAATMVTGWNNRITQVFMS